MLLGVVAERAIADLQKIRSLGAYAVGFFQRRVEVPALGFRDLLFKVEPLRWKGRGTSGTGSRRTCGRISSYTVGKNAQGDLSASLEGDGSFHGVLELADVPRPIVRFEPADCFRRKALD